MDPVYLSDSILICFDLSLQDMPVIEGISKKLMCIIIHYRKDSPPTLLHTTSTIYHQQFVTSATQHVNYLLLLMQDRRNYTNIHKKLVLGAQFDRKKKVVYNLMELLAPVSVLKMTAHRCVMRAPFQNHSVLRCMIVCNVAENCIRCSQLLMHDAHLIMKLADRRRCRVTSFT